MTYRLGLEGVVVGQGETYGDALEDVSSAIRFHIESFGEEAIETDEPVIEAFVPQAEVSA